MKLKIFIFLLNSITPFLILGCNSSNKSTTNIEVERGKIYEANVTDSSNPPIIAKMTKGSNIYTFDSKINYPVIVKGGWIDVDGDGNQTTADLLNDLNLTSYSNVITPITTYIGDITSNKGKNRLKELMSEMNITKANLFKVPSKSIKKAIFIANSIFIKAKKDNIKIHNILFSDIKEKFNDIKDMDMNGTKTSKEMAKFIENKIIKKNGIKRITKEYLDKKNKKINETNETKECNCSLEIIKDDSSFKDVLPSNDIKWSSSTEDVKAIQDAFNYAREKDSTISKKLIMPSQAKWDVMDNQEKALFLLNKERYDRKIKPFEGINKDVIDVAQKYSNLLYSKGKFGHQEDGTPWERLKTKDSIKNNQDFFKYAENLYVAGSSSEYTKNSIAKAIYSWIYDDKGSSWGHRKFCLAVGLKDNSGKDGMEGLIGFGIKTGNDYKYANYSILKSTIIVMNVFDPGKDWDHKDTNRVSIHTQESNNTNKEEQNSSRFKVDAEKGIVIDVKTNLMWQNNSLGHLAKDDAIKKCNNLEYNNFSDWRLPKKEESSIFHLEMNKANIIPNQLFSGCTAEITENGYVRTKKGAENKDGIKPGDSVNFRGKANVRCVRNN